MFSLKHVKCLSCKFQIVSAWWAWARGRKVCLFFMQTTLELLQNSHFSCWFYLSFPKAGALTLWYPSAWMRKPMLRDDRKAKPHLGSAARVLEFHFQGWTPAAQSKTKLSIYLPRHTGSSSWFWINLFHVTLLFSKAQIRLSNTWSTLSHQVLLIPVPSSSKISFPLLPCKFLQPLWCIPHTDARWLFRGLLFFFLSAPLHLESLTGFRSHFLTWSAKPSMNWPQLFYSASSPFKLWSSCKGTCHFWKTDLGSEVP